MAYPHPHFPILNSRHLEGAQLFADRESMLRQFASSIPALQLGRVAEIGVALGDFSKLLIEELKPSEFVAFDLFEMHKSASHWGVSSEKLFGGLSHQEVFEKRFADLPTPIVCRQGSSDLTVPLYPDGYFDLIYVDAQHEYPGVSADAENARQKLDANGIMIFNDYIMYDHMLGAPYGVVQAVNELITKHDLHVLGFALQQHMFCDIAVSRIPLSQQIARTKAAGVGA